MGRVRAQEQKASTKGRKNNTKNNYVCKERNIDRKERNKEKRKEEKGNTRWTEERNEGRMNKGTKERKTKRIY